MNPGSPAHGTSMRFGVLGPVQAWPAGGEPVPLGGPRPRSLLAMLALEAGRVVGSDRLIDGLYGSAPPGDAGNALQSQVSRLRARLGGLIELRPGGYLLVAEDVDAQRFAALAGAGQAALSTGDHAGAARVLREALGLWRGPALADVLDAPFAAAAAARLEELRVSAAEDLAEAGLAIGESAALVAELTALVAAHPLRERLRGLLMRALYGSGRAADALAVFEEGRRLLAEELGADPSPELAEVHLAVLRADAAPVRGVPAQLTSFVGREAELARVVGLLGTARLVTLTGPGGAGKTRLAIEAAARSPVEVSFVDLSVVDGGVARAVLAALGLRESGLLPSTEGPSDAAGRLLVALADRNVVLVLDNCEHVVAEAAALAHRLLAGCPGLRVLATSREPLGITGEVLHPLPPLAIEPAVRLFADRAAAVRPGFAVDDAVRRICAALDGLPLAIELAAARLRTLSLAELENRLNDRFRLLSHGSRTAAPRHQTLHAVVEWSWDLLDPDERLLARRLAVFAGGATVESATAVCGFAAERVEDLLSGLADKSLVDSAAGRYRMLDTIREFCAARLVAAGEQDRILAAHARYFLALATEADTHLRRTEQLVWLDRLAGEHGNLLAALRWAVRADPGLALALIGAASWYWYLRGVREEVTPLAVELLEELGHQPPPDALEEYLLCVLASGSTDPAHQEQLRKIVTTIPGPVRQPYAMVAWALHSGPPATGADLGPLQEWFATTEDPWCSGLFRFGIGMMAFYGGTDPAFAEAECLAALERFRVTGDRWGLAQALDALATFADALGDTDKALALTDQAIEVVDQLGAIEELADLHCRRADRLVRAGRDAAADYERSAELARRAGVPATLALAHSGLGELARRAGDLAAARRWHELALGESTVDWVGVGARSAVLTALGRVAEEQGAFTEARSCYLRAVELARSNRIPTTVDEAVAGLARLGDHTS